MRCEWTYTGELEGDRRIAVCTRKGCGRVLKVPPSSKRIDPDIDCRRGVPHWWELGSFLMIFLSIWGINKRRYRNFRRWFLGIKSTKCCRCVQREDWLNGLIPQAIGRFNQAIAWLTRYNTNKGER